MAELYLCTALGPEGFEKEVVIKRVRSFLASDEGFMKMFVDEARLASRLNHVNVVQIFDFAKHDDTSFIAMEYVRGVSLWELRRRCRELQVSCPPTLAAEICASVARGLHYAHTLTDKGKPLGIVHRDVTPHNVLLSFDGAVKLTDFGIAKAGTSSSYTAPGMLKGKFAYMAPEQARGEAVDARSDVFALGIVLWELLTGGRLFEGDSDVAILRAVQESFIAPPARLNPAVPEELDQLVLKALARPKEQRFQTAQEMERALANFVLRNASSVEDTSVAAFLATLFGQEVAGPHRQREATRSTAKTPTPAPEPKDPGATIPPTAIVARDHTPTPPRKTAQLPGVGPALTLLDDEPSVIAPLEPSGPSVDLDQTLDATFEKKVEVRESLLEEVERARAAIAAERHAKSTDPAAATVSLENVRAPRWSRGVRVLGACVAGGLLAGVGYAVFSTRGGNAPQPLSQYAPTSVPKAQAPLREGDTPVAATAPARTPLIEDAHAAGAVAVGAAHGVAAPPPEQEAAAVPSPAEASPVEVPAAEASAAAVVTAEAAPVARPKAAPKVKTGYLKVNAIPFAQVFVDGKLMAEVSGEKRLPVKAGPHEVRLKHPKRVETFKVVIEPGVAAELTFEPLR